VTLPVLLATEMTAEQRAVLEDTIARHGRELAGAWLTAHAAYIAASDVVLLAKAAPHGAHGWHLWNLAVTKRQVLHAFEAERADSPRKSEVARLCELVAPAGDGARIPLVLEVLDVHGCGLVVFGLERATLDEALGLEAGS
jgi:hypothetical protein